MGRPKKQQDVAQPIVRELTVTQPKVQQHSLTDTLARLKTFSQYKNGWHDGEGQSINQDVIDTAAILVSSLVTKDIQVLVFPTILGGVSIESIDNNENSFIIDVYADNKLDLILNETLVGELGVTENSMETIIKIVLGSRSLN